MAGRSGIRVKGLDRLLIEDKHLKIYFGKPKNGGGVISKIYYPLLDNDAVIVFRDADVVHNVLSVSKHILQGSSMKIFRLPPMVFTTIEARLEEDIASIVLGSDIRDELEYVADVEIVSVGNGCVLKGNWYQIERAWQIIHLAMGKQEKIQYHLQQQLSMENGDEKLRPRHQPQGKSTDLSETDDSEDETLLKSVPQSYYTGRKMQDSFNSVIGASVTNSVIGQTPFEDDIAEEVRNMGRNQPLSIDNFHDDSDTDMYTSHRYQQQKMADKGDHSSYKAADDKGGYSSYKAAEDNGGYSSYKAAEEKGGYSSYRSGSGKGDYSSSYRTETEKAGHSSYRSDMQKGGHSSYRPEIENGDRTSYLPRSSSGSGPVSLPVHRRLASPSDQTSTHNHSGHESMRVHITGSTYDRHFPRTDTASLPNQRDAMATRQEVGSKTYTVTKDHRPSPVTKDRPNALLDDVQMDSDESDIQPTSSRSQNHHRLQDQNDTFQHFSSQISITDEPDSVARISTSRQGSNDRDARGTTTTPKSGQSTHLKQTPGHTTIDVSPSNVRAVDDIFNNATSSVAADVDRPFSSMPPQTSYRHDYASSSREKSHVSDARSHDEYKASHMADSSPDLELEKAISASLKSSGHLEDYSSVDSYEFKVGEIKVKIYRGNITEVRTSGIVNAANGYLAHGAGIAGAIAMAAGPSMQQECEELKRKYGALETATVVHTQAGGKLHREVHYILHAVGPIWIEAIKGRCSFELILTYLNCFKYAEKIWLDSISLPCISAGIFGCPLDVSIQSFLDGLLLFHSECGENCHLREVHLVNNDPDGVVTSIVLIKSLLDNGLDSAVAQSLDRYATLSKTHGGAIRTTKTLRKIPVAKSKDDDSVGAKSSADVKRIPARRTSSLQRTDRKSSADSDSRVPASGYGSRNVVGTSNSSASKGVGTRDHTTDSSTRQSLKDRSSVRSRAEEKPSSARARDTASTSGRYKSPRGSSGHRSESSRSQGVVNDPSENGLRSPVSGKKKISDRILASQGHTASVSSPRPSSTSKTYALMKQPLVGASSGTRPKQTSSLSKQGKTTPVKATTLRPEGGSGYGDHNRDVVRTRSYNSAAYLEGSQSLPMDMNTPPYSSTRLRGNSPRRYPTERKY